MDTKEKKEIHCLMCLGVGTIELTDEQIVEYRNMHPLARIATIVAMQGITKMVIRCLERSNEGDMLICMACSRDVPVRVEHGYKILRCDECGHIYYVRLEDQGGKGKEEAGH